MVQYANFFWPVFSNLVLQAGQNLKERENVTITIIIISNTYSTSQLFLTEEGLGNFGQSFAEIS